MAGQALALAGCHPLATWAGSYFVKAVLGRLNLPKDDDPGLAEAGRWIGYLERFLVVTLVLFHQFSAIAFIFAGKSLARLRWQKEVEYYLVGTLASLSWAVFWGLVLGALLGWLR